jgi:hypothetical protein
MNRTALALLLPHEFGSNASERASWDFCLNPQLQEEIGGYRPENRFRPRPTSANELFSSGPDPSASVIAGQTDSPELVQFGYFPL